MFSFEEGSGEVIDRAVSKYENHFDAIFPIHEYSEMTANKDYDFSLSGSKKLADFIDQRISENSPVSVPGGYENRVY